MKPCGHCQRHILDGEQSCPFCRQRVSSVGATLVLGAALGFGSVSCTNKEGGTDTGAATEPGTTDEGGSYYAGPTVGDTWDSSSTTILDSSSSDSGGSYYAGPSGSSTTWEESSSSSSTDTDTDSTSSSTGESSDSTDAGGSYYAGPSTSTGVWDEEDKPA